MRRGSPLLDSAPPASQRMTVDEPLGPSPNRRDLSYRGDFGGVKRLANPLARASEAVRNTGSAMNGPRTSTKNVSSLSAPSR